jgi:ABC-type sulfate transport system substrate-binding protein
MRSVRRLALFTKPLINDYLQYLYEDTDLEIPNQIKIEDKEYIIIKDYWEKFPDSRLTQVLVNTGILPNAVGFWYYKEETTWLKEQKIYTESYLYYNT